MKRLKFENAMDFIERMKIKADDPATLEALVRCAYNPVQFELPFIEFFQLVSLIQLGLKHPEIKHTEPYKLGCAFVDQILESLREREPLIAAIIEKGKPE